MFIARRAIASIAAGTQPSPPRSLRLTSPLLLNHQRELMQRRRQEIVMLVWNQVYPILIRPRKACLKPNIKTCMAMTTDAARDGPVKAAEMEETVGDTATRTMVEGAKQVKEAVLGEDEKVGPSKKSLSEDDTDSIEDLRRRAGGYDKKDR